MAKRVINAAAKNEDLKVIVSIKVESKASSLTQMELNTKTSYIKDALYGLLNRDFSYDEITIK